MAMRLLAVSDDGHFTQEQFAKDSIPSYAILSHRWSTHEDDEVTFKEIAEGIHDKKKPGYQKLHNARHLNKRRRIYRPCILSHANAFESKLKA
jgi:hypothetical protein